MDSATYDWHYRHNREALELALNPPPPRAPPTPPTLAELRSKKAEVLAKEYQAWCKQQGITEPGDLSREEWLKTKQAEADQAAMEKASEKWTQLHPEICSLRNEPEGHGRLSA
jgi:hypothetical protein